MSRTNIIKNSTLPNLKLILGLPSAGFVKNFSFMTAPSLVARNILNINTAKKINTINGNKLNIFSPFIHPSTFKDKIPLYYIIEKMECIVKIRLEIVVGEWV